MRITTRHLAYVLLGFLLVNFGLAFGNYQLGPLPLGAAFTYQPKLLQTIPVGNLTSDVTGENPIIIPVPLSNDTVANLKKEGAKQVSSTDQYEKQLQTLWFAKGSQDPYYTVYSTQIVKESIGPLLTDMSPSRMVPYLWDFYQSDMVKLGYTSESALRQAVIQDTQGLATKLSVQYDWGWMTTCGPNSGPSCPAGGSVFGKAAAAYWTPQDLSYAVAALGGATESTFLQLTGIYGFDAATVLEAMMLNNAAGGAKDTSIGKGNVDPSIYGNSPFILQGQNPTWFVTPPCVDQPDGSCYHNWGTNGAQVYVPPGTLYTVTPTVVGSVQVGPQGCPQTAQGGVDVTCANWWYATQASGGIGAWTGGGPTYMVIPEDVVRQVGQEACATPSLSAGGDCGNPLTVGQNVLTRIQGVLEGLSTGVAIIQNPTPGAPGGGCAGGGMENAANNVICIAPDTWSWFVSWVSPDPTTGTSKLGVLFQTWNQNHPNLDSLQWSSLAQQSGLPYWVTATIPQPSDAILDEIAYGRIDISKIQTGTRIGFNAQTLFAPILLGWVAAYGWTKYFSLSACKSDSSLRCYNPTGSQGSLPLDTYYALLTQPDALKAIAQANGWCNNGVCDTAKAQALVERAFSNAQTGGTQIQQKNSIAGTFLTGWIIGNELGKLDALCQKQFCNFWGQDPYLQDLAQQGVATFDSTPGSPGYAAYLYFEKLKNDILTSSSLSDLLAKDPYLPTATLNPAPTGMCSQTGTGNEVPCGAANMIFGPLIAFLVQNPTAANWKTFQDALPTCEAAANVGNYCAVDWNTGGVYEINPNSGAWLKCDLGNPNGKCTTVSVKVTASQTVYTTITYSTGGFETTYTQTQTVGATQTGALTTVTFATTSGAFTWVTSYTQTVQGLQSTYQGGGPFNPPPQDPNLPATIPVYPSVSTLAPAGAKVSNTLPLGPLTWIDPLSVPQIQSLLSQPVPPNFNWMDANFSLFGTGVSMNWFAWVLMIVLIFSLWLVNITIYKSKRRYRH